MARDPDHAPF